MIVYEGDLRPDVDAWSVHLGDRNASDDEFVKVYGS